MGCLKTSHDRLLVGCRRALLSLFMLVLLASCAGIDVGTIYTVRPNEFDVDAATLAVGEIRFVVDGKRLDYHFLNRPHFMLYRLHDKQYFETPETGSDGRYAWSIPEGDYRVAVLYGGMGPTGVPHFMENGVVMHVNGFVKPGLKFRIRKGRVNYLGVLEVDVSSKRARTLLRESVFDRVNDIRVLDELSSQAGDISLPEGIPVSAPLLQYDIRNAAIKAE